MVQPAVWWLPQPFWLCWDSYFSLTPYWPPMVWHFYTWPCSWCSSPCFYGLRIILSEVGCWERTSLKGKGAMVSIYTERSHHLMDFLLTFLISRLLMKWEPIPVGIEKIIENSRYLIGCEPRKCSCSDRWMIPAGTIRIKNIHADSIRMDLRLSNR